MCFWNRGWCWQWPHEPFDACDDGLAVLGVAAVGEAAVVMFQVHGGPHMW